jgi:hypothetical protein
MCIGTGGMGNDSDNGSGSDDEDGLLLLDELAAVTSSQVDGDEAPAESWSKFDPSPSVEEKSNISSAQTLSSKRVIE